MKKENTKINKSSIIIVKFYCLDGKIITGTKISITKLIKKIEKGHDYKDYEFGKTFDPDKRINESDYRNSNYEGMYLLYESHNLKDVDEIFKFYSAKFDKPYKENFGKEEYADKVVLKKTNCIIFIWLYK